MPHKISWPTAASLVIANMIGSGVFSSLGYQLVGLNNTYSILLLWTLGGLLALIGAFTFAELGAYYQESGGDYLFISRAIHPLPGYLSAWISMWVGFAAPVAVAGITLEHYARPLGIPHLRLVTVALIIAISAIHSVSLRQSGRFQNINTLFKVLFILGLIAAGFWAAPATPNALLLDASYKDEILLPAFAVSLLYVSYAYTGWNAAAYIVGEIEAPNRNLPRALILGTLFVGICYVLMQYVLLRQASPDSLRGQADVVLIAVEQSWGAKAQYVVSIGIALQLIGTMSSYIWIGPRVIQSMARSYRLWRPLAHGNRNQIPVRAIWLQCAITLGLLFSGSLEQVLLYTSFLLQLMGTLAVASLLFTPRRPDTFHSPFRPWLQILYVVFSTAILIYIASERPWESAAGMLLLLGGVGTYYVAR